MIGDRAKMIDEHLDIHSAKRKMLKPKERTQVQQNSTHNRREKITEPHKPKNNQIFLKSMTSGLHPAIRGQIDMLNKMKV